MKPILEEIISGNQSAFLRGRLISENSMLAHELLRAFNKKGDAKVCLKVDLRKAYDTVSRQFICKMLNGMGFPSRWVMLIHECMSTATMSILINQAPVGFLKASCGIRQGDLLSSYLFTVAMEYLSISLEVERLKGNIRPLLPKVTPNISHLIYADDLLIISKADDVGINTIKEVFETFGYMSGLRMNNISI